MNFEIVNEDWTPFFESLSKRRFEWLTKVEVLRSEIGDQILTDGLPMNGFTVEMQGGRTSIDISGGYETTESHLTDKIINPTRVTFLASGNHHPDVIDIEEQDGTTTLITFIEPRDILVGFGKAEVLVAGV
jgi:hypothetical protein